MRYPFEPEHWETMTSRVVVTKHAFPRQATFPAVCLFLMIISALLLIPLRVSAQSSVAPERGQVRVLVQADLSHAPDADQVIIRIVDNTDKQLLANIAEQLGERFHAQPTNITFEAGNREFIKDKGIGVNFYLPVLPREQGHALPVAPFLEVLAPYASHLQMLYLIQGDYACTGYESYRNAAVTLAPEPVRNAAALHIAFYGLRAEISSPNLTGSLPQTPGRAGKHNNRILKLLGFLVLAGAIGALIGLGLSIILNRWKS